MNFQDQLQNLLASLQRLGLRKLAALGVVGVLTAAVVGFGGYWLSRPAYETLYGGLDRQDVANIGSALTEAGIPFDVAADGASVKVRYSETARARMLLAEKGLPHSASSGYELYDKLGSLGLTSFMQDVTRVRATEGELARTIQLMNGIRAARVHIVLPDEGSFRRAKQPPSASVMIRTETIADARTGQAIRHLVAAAVPGMSVDLVTVLNTDGTLLSSGDDLQEQAPGKMLTLEKTVSKDIQDNIRRELTPYLGLHNFQISVAAKLNTDNRQTNETIYNPDSRVERSTRVVKENNTVNNSTSQAPTSVASAVPQDKPAASTAADAKSSTTDNSKREELTNYELSSKVVTTVSGGYGIDHLSIAVLVNRTALANPKGGSAATQLADIEALVNSAAGLRKERGDTIKVLAADFAEAGHDLDPIPSPGSPRRADAPVRHRHQRARRRGGGDPARRLRNPAADPRAAPGGGAGRDGSGRGCARCRPWRRPLTEIATGPQIIEARNEASLIEDVTSRPRRSPQRRLEQMVEFDEDQAATILKQWVARGSLA